MSGALSISIADQISPRLQALFAGLGDDRRHDFNESMGLPVAEATRRYLDGLAGTRHDTANALGATPSGFFAQAAEKVNLVADAGSATVSIDQPGMGRAAHDVDIDASASGKQALTIPLIAAAYNQRAYAVEGLFPVAILGGTETFLAKEDPDGGLVFWYELVPKVHQEQDRTMLPSDEAIGQAAKEGVLAYVDSLLAGTAGGAAS